MYGEIRGKLLDIAAELIVSPLAAVAKAHEIKEGLAGNETYLKAKDTVKNAAEDVRGTAKKAYENGHVQKCAEAVRETAGKVSESEAFIKAKEGIKEAASRIFADKASEDAKPQAEDSEEEAETSDYADAAGAEEAVCGNTQKDEEQKRAFAEDIEDVIDEVDISEIITEDDAKEDIPED